MLFFISSAKVQKKIEKQKFLMIKNVKIKIKRYLYIKYCNIMNYDKIINEEIDRFRKKFQFIR